MSVKVRGPFETTKSSVKCSGGKTVQSGKRECDINHIVGKIRRTGVVPPPTRESFYADVSGFGDFQESLMRVQAGNELFMRLPASVRQKFRNDPQAFFDFAYDPKNLDALREMGLVEPLNTNVPISQLPTSPDPPAGAGGDSGAAS